MTIAFTRFTAIRSGYRYGLAFILMLAFALPSRGRQVESQVCSFSLEESLKNGTLNERASDSSINFATYQEMRLLVRAFHLGPTLYFKTGQCDTNAYAFRRQPGEQDTDGTVVIGVSLINRELIRSGGTARNFSIPAIMGHEFGHLVQFKYGTTATGVLVELQADYLAGWYLGNRQNGYRPSEQDIQSALNSFYENADYEFTSTQQHGSPEQRTGAVLAGFSHSSLKFNEVYESSFSFIGVPSPNRQSALWFSVTEFESVLDSVLAKRGTGFADLKGSLSPGSKSRWNATTLLPGATECEVVWMNEYQGSYECTMFETLDIQIGTNAWQNLVDELQNEGWKATIDTSPSKLELKSATFKSNDQELTLDLDKKALSTLPYGIDLTIPFDNY